jgi:hypothetical protein
MSTMEEQSSPIMPPEPPVIRIKPNRGSGNFDYLKSQSERRMLSTAFQAITLTETWNFVEQPIDSFMCSGDKRVRAIYDKIEELGYHGHSGSSFGVTMRNMQYIARNGAEDFKRIMLSNQQ